MRIEIISTIAYWEAEAKEIAIDIMDFAIICASIEQFEECINFLKERENVDAYFELAYMKESVWVFQKNRAIRGQPMIERYLEITPEE